MEVNPKEQLKMNKLQEDHKALVAALSKDGKEIVRSLTPEGAHWWHMSSALCGEAGELFDAIKKYVVYEAEIDIRNVIEELGDIEFYLEGLRSSMNITREETLANNIMKLDQRYGEAYSNEAAEQRVDKA